MDAAVEEKIRDRLDRGAMTSRAVLSTFRMLDEGSRLSPSYLDSRYAPFYYFLGQELRASTVLEFGFGIGIPSGCYVRGHKDTDAILSFQESGKTYYSPRIGIHNVKNYFRGVLDVYVGQIHDDAFVDKAKARKWELALLNEECGYGDVLERLEFAWDRLGLGGTVALDHVSSHDPTGAAYRDFCRRKGRSSRIIPTKYGVGVITK